MELIFQRTKLDKIIALALWAELSGTAGAYAPWAIEEMVCEEADEVREMGLFEIVKKATEMAWKRHCDSPPGGPPPKSPMVQLVDGRTRGIVWLSDSHKIRLWENANGTWYVSALGPEDSHRVSGLRGRFELSYYFDDSIEFPENPYEVG